MARIFDMDEAAYEEWLGSRPALIAQMARRFRPDTLYRLKGTVHCGFPISYNENGTVTVSLIARFNAALLFERQVFGINPDDLSECDIPADASTENQPLLMDEAEIRAMCAVLRESEPVKS